MNKIIFEKEINFNVFERDKKKKLDNENFILKIYKIDKNNNNIIYFFELTSKNNNFFSYNKLLNKEDYLKIKEKINIDILYWDFEVYIKNILLLLEDKEENIKIKLRLYDNYVSIELYEYVKIKNLFIILFNINLNSTSDEIKRKIINQKHESLCNEIINGENHLEKLSNELFNNYPTFFNELKKLKLI